MALTPVEIRHLELKRGFFGYRRSVVHRMMDDIADSFESVWRERSQLAERVEELEGEVSRHVELEGLLRSTLVSAERAAHDMKDTARREADVIVSEANGEARKLLRDAITQKESLMGDVRRIQALLRAALSSVEDSPGLEGATGEPGTGAEQTAATSPTVQDEPTDPGLRRLA